MSIVWFRIGFSLNIYRSVLFPLIEWKRTTEISNVLVEEFVQNCDLSLLFFTLLEMTPLSYIERLFLFKNGLDYSRTVIKHVEKDLIPLLVLWMFFS